MMLQLGRYTHGFALTSKLDPNALAKVKVEYFRKWVSIGLKECSKKKPGIWTLTNNTGSPLTRVLIDAGPGDTVFDIYWDPYPGTPGSADGRTFEVTSDHTGLNIVATYRGLVALSGFDPVGDLYRYLDIQFLTAGELKSGSELKYRSDTDNIMFAGDIEPIEPIPEPGTLMLLGTGLAGLGGFARLKLRRRKS